MTKTAAPKKAKKNKKPDLIAAKLPFRQPAMLVVMALVAVVGIAFIFKSYAAGTAYYVDCSAGNDTNSGANETAAWKTLTKASSAALNPGDKLLLKRGCTWTNDQLVAKWKGSAAQPIVIGNYGAGNLPLLQSNRANAHTIVISGTYQNIASLATKGIAPTTDPGCSNAAVGWMNGFHFEPSATYNTVENVEATGFSAGAEISTGAHHNKLVRSLFVGNTMMSSLTPTTVNSDDDAGASGVIVAGDDNEIAYNTISDNVACSYDYKADGSAVEIYGGQRNTIHHNRAGNNDVFTELGNSRSADNTFAYNVVTSTLDRAVFLVTRGAASSSWGPVARTTAYNNTVYFTSLGGSAAAVVCAEGCGPDILNFKNNIVWANGAGGVAYADAAFNESNNVYWKTGGNPKIWYAHTTTSLKTDPQFVNAGGLDFHLGASSPAVDKGVIASINAGYAKDFDDKSVPIGAGVDMGAFEYGAAATPAPTITPTPTPTPPATNLLLNSSFENSTAPWTFQAKSPASASLARATDTKVDGAYSAKITIKRSASSNWYAQLQQERLALVAGKTYHVSFWAKATKARTIESTVQQAYAPYTSQASNAVKLTTSWAQYSYSFTAKTSEPNAFLAFNMANATGSVWLDKVSVVSN